MCFDLPFISFISLLKLKLNLLKKPKEAKARKASLLNNGRKSSRYAYRCQSIAVAVGSRIAKLTNSDDVFSRVGSLAHNTQSETVIAISSMDQHAVLYE